jgi:hypothetical protein
MICLSVSNNLVRGAFKLLAEMTSRLTTIAFNQFQLPPRVPLFSPPPCLPFLEFAIVGR